MVGWEQSSRLTVRAAVDQPEAMSLLTLEPERGVIGVRVASSV